MGTVTTQDGVEIFYKDWGSGQPVVFHHGWPLSSDDWDPQMMFFLSHGYRAALAANRAQLYIDIPAGPFYGFNRPGAKVSQGVINNWWRQAMMGSIKAQYECIKAFSETDFTEDLKAIQVPVLVIHSEDDQIVPYSDSAPLTVKLLKKGALKTYKDLPHGLFQTHPEIVNPEILAFIRGQEVKQQAAA